MESEMTKNVDKKEDEKKEKVEREVLKEISKTSLKLHIEVGRIDMKLNEILSLKEGSVITLNREIDDVVNLSLNGEIIGRGKLVNVEGKLGVKILEIRK